MTASKRSIKIGISALALGLALAGGPVPLFGAEQEQELAEQGKKVKLNVGGIDQQGAKITGIVKYGGKVSKTKKVIDMSSDKFCTVSHAQPVPRQLHRVFGTNGEDKVIQNVFVWISKGLESKDFSVPGKPVVLNQNGCIYTPHLMGVMVGQELHVLNNDKTNHNVHSYVGRKTVDNNASGPGSTIRWKFKRAMKLKVKCDVHSWMTGYVHVVEHPFFAVTQDDGTFELRGVPPGEYEVSVWHEYRRYKPDNEKLTVKVAEGETKKIEFTYKPQKRESKKKP